jgi:glycosidase
MSSFATGALGQERPGSIRRNVSLPRRQEYYPSPVDWRDQVLYFLLVDRFSDAQEDARPRLDRHQLSAARPGNWRWDLWAESGAERWQGGTLQGVRSKLGYLKQLGVTALWLSPVFMQRVHQDSYHGYGIQDFLDVDPHFGDRSDLVDLVAEAHDQGLRVILDIIFNHSGPNWLYPPGTPGGEWTPHYTTGRYPFGSWLDSSDQAAPAIQDREAGVWPGELQDSDRYTRAGTGNLGAGDLADPNAEHKRSDFYTLRDFRLDAPGLLTDLALCYKYWIALTDCDGFRIDTLKHVSFEQARNFCGTIKEFAANLGKANFFLVGEIAGGDYAQERYLEVLDRNLNAALDIGEMRLTLHGVAKGLVNPQEYFAKGFDTVFPGMGSHRNLGNRHVSILDDHDHVSGEKVRFSAEAASDHQVAAGVALQLFSLGIPCIYYGTEQAFAGPEPSERKWLPSWKSGDHADRYLREAMFGPEHPRSSGRSGSQALDPVLPGFGPFGTSGHHCFDDRSASYLRIAAVTALRQAYPVLRHGRQYARPISFLGRPFAVYGPGEIVAWSRILDDEEALCVLNAHGTDERGADVLVDATLNPPGSTMTVVLNTAQAGQLPAGAVAHPIGSSVPVRQGADGKAYVEIRHLPPSEVLVLTNHPQADRGAILP